MKRIILAVVLCLVFSTSVMAGRSTDILLTCWTDAEETKSLNDAATIILYPYNKTVKLIDQYNNVQNDKVVIAEYFYTITIPRNTQYSKVGEIKINRLTGRFSSVWRYPETETKLSKPTDLYGMCIKNPEAGSRIF